MDDSRINKLSRRHRDVLRGVAHLRKTKQIAADLGIAPGTVDGYIAEAVRIMGAVDRGDAARRLVEHEKEAPGLSGVQSPWVGADPSHATQPPQPVAEPEAAETTGSPPHRSPSIWQLPLRHPGQRNVDAPIAVRLLWIPVIAVVLAIGFGAVVNGLQVLTGLIEGLSHLAR